MATNENIRNVTPPEYRFWPLEGVGLPNERSDRTIFLLMTKISEVFSVREDACD